MTTVNAPETGHAESTITVVARALAPELPNAETDPNYREDAIRILDALKGHLDSRLAQHAVKVSSLLVRITDNQRKMARRLIDVSTALADLAERTITHSELTEELANLMKEKEENDATHSERTAPDAG